MPLAAVSRGPHIRVPIQIEIEKLVHGGMGLGRVDGRVVLVPYVLPGELVEIEPVRETKSLIRGRLVKRVRPSEARITPPVLCLSCVEGATTSTSLISNSLS